MIDANAHVYILSSKETQPSSRIYQFKKKIDIGENVMAEGLEYEVLNHIDFDLPVYRSVAEVK